MALLISVWFVVMFLIGLAAGISAAHNEAWQLFSDSDFRVQWETLVTGFFALIGGGAAYFGATEPYRRRTKQEIIAYIVNVKKLAGNILNVNFVRESVLWHYEQMREDERKDLFLPTIERIKDGLAPPPISAIDYDISTAYDHVVMSARSMHAFEAYDMESLLILRKRLLNFIEDLEAKAGFTKR
ncbi:MAG: hypothetical protein GYB52_06785 [Rhodospirillales bacterium]|nr:hypothetical protein [Rhodospirillales bacterium]MBR9816319.1 hypothetical protein [Rhodospirillales bacterium]